MPEKLIDIVEAIDGCFRAKVRKHILTYARIHCVYDGENKTFWLCDKSYIKKDLGGIEKYGIFAHKNSAPAIKMLTNDVGSTFEYSCMDGYNIKRLNHCVEVENRSDFGKQIIVIAGDNITYQYRDIGEYLRDLRKNQDDIKDIENKIAELKKNRAELEKLKGNAQEKAQITRSISAFEREYRILTQQQEDLKNITIYIRKQGEMRYSQIIDPIQTRIKTQNLFDGTTLIIDGGPGTGKSTTMIQRLKYLTDKIAIEEDKNLGLNNYKLNIQQRKQLIEAIDHQRDWMFFSPSPILKDYLAEAMRKEGLENVEEKVWHWKDYCRMVLEDYYGLIGATEGEAPFKLSYDQGNLFFQDWNIVEMFINFYLDQFRNIKSKLPPIPETKKTFEWIAIAQNIKERFNKCDNYNMSQFISLFNSLESVYGEDCKKLLQNENEAISRIVEEIDEKIKTNPNLWSVVEAYLELTDGDETNEDEVIVEDETENKRLPIIRKWLKAYCRSKTDSKYKMSEKQQLVGEKLIPLIGDEHDDDIQKIGEIIIFERYAQYTKGVKPIMLSGLPARYKRFRTYLSRSKYEGCDRKLLNNLIQRKNGRELHQQEQSLLLGFINTLVRQIQTSTEGKVKHPYVQAYEELSRPVIGIDEATDFSACDIYAMQSFRLKDFGSVTLSGDMMQRLTPQGICSWKELDEIVPNPEVVELKISYRQSRKLIELAGRLYENTLGGKPTYRPFMKSSKVPEPLAYVSDNEHSKVEWIAKRISEVFRAYGDRLPSIAIFVNDKGYIPGFIEKLSKNEFFVENKINVLEGTNDNAKTEESHICVYPIDVIKGMEFDVVFFHNIDNSSEDVDSLKRYLYVGVSRAAFFLGVTFIEPNSQIGKYFVYDKDWFKI